MSNHRVCPVWLGYFLASPLRKLFENPYRILKGYINPGMRVLDIGCAMGFYSMPMAELTGNHGKVFCIDLQEGMIRVLKKRAVKSGFAEYIEARVCNADSLCIADLKDSIDFALASAVVHEVPDRNVFFRDIAAVLKQNAEFLVLEPRGHVSASDFAETISIAEKNGLQAAGNTEASRSRTVLLRKL